MRTVIIIVIGLAVLALSALAGWRFGGGSASMVTWAKIFIPVWLAAALANMWTGVSRGYSVAEELPIFLVIFVIPTAAAAWIWWKYS